MPPSSLLPAYLSQWLPGKFLVSLPGLSPRLLFLEELTHSCSTRVRCWPESTALGKKVAPKVAPSSGRRDETVSIQHIVTSGVYVCAARLHTHVHPCARGDPLSG